MGNNEKQFKTVLGEEKFSISMEAGRFFFFFNEKEYIRAEGRMEGEREGGK